MNPMHKYVMATLVKGGIQFEIEGRRPRVAVIDVGASAIMALAFGDTLSPLGGHKRDVLDEASCILTLFWRKVQVNFLFTTAAQLINPNNNKKNLFYIIGTHLGCIPL